MPFFKRGAAADISLTGRIHAQLKNDAHLIVEELKKLKENLRQELDAEDDESHLWNSFEAVVNPLIREYANIEKKLNIADDTLEEKTSMLQSYTEWVKKAKLWVALVSKPTDREEIVQAVVDHTAHVSDLLIDRDLKTLREYMMHEIQVLSHSHDLGLLPQAIEKKLRPHIEGLISLKNCKPADLKLEHLQAWKTEIDELRTKHYNNALQIIDQEINSLFPAQKIEEDQEHLKEIFNLIAYLEEEIPHFLRETLRPMDLEQKAILEEHAEYLESEIHQLNGDLRLTPELADRVQILIKTVEEAHRNLRR